MKRNPWIGIAIIVSACLIGGAHEALAQQAGLPQDGSGGVSRQPDGISAREVHQHAWEVRVLPEASRRRAASILVQDYQGRMKPVDTLARELVRKITKKFDYEGWDPTDLYLSWLAAPEHWWRQPLLYVKHPGLRAQLGVAEDVKRITPASLLDAAGHYRLAAAVEEAHRTPDRDRSKLQRKLLALDDRLNLFSMAVQGRMMRVFPVPGDPRNSWISGPELAGAMQGPAGERAGRAYESLMRGLRDKRPDLFLGGLSEIEALQAEHGSAVLPGSFAMSAELLLNRLNPFAQLLWPYFLGSCLLLAAYVWGIVRRAGAPYPWRHPLYLSGVIMFAAAMFGHLAAYAARWIASGRAPLSNGYESLLFIALSVAVAGIAFEIRDRRGAAGGLASLLTFVVLGISMASHFDPAIGPLVPVLNSYWLNYHVTIITASYGFLGLAALIGAMMLILFICKGPGRENLHQAILRLDRLLNPVVAWGLALLTVGTLLGGVWANESWGRYWGWDPKETWSLVTILVYAMVQHFRWVPSLNRPWLLAAGSLAGIASVVMTYFGVNYFLAGLHSYASGGAATVPAWVYIGSAITVALIAVSGVRDRTRSWKAHEDRDVSRGVHALPGES